MLDERVRLIDNPGPGGALGRAAGGGYGRAAGWI